MKSLTDKLSELQSMIEDPARKRVYEKDGYGYAHKLIVRLARENALMLRALDEYKRKLEDSGAYIVEDYFEEPWHCELLRYVEEALAEILKEKE